jgi:hypothetical protein
MKSMAKGPGKRAHTPGSKTALPVAANVDIAAIRANITGVLNDQGRQHRQMPPGVDVPMPKRCYVYAIHVDGVLRYFGKGTNGRMYAHMKEVRERLTRKFKLENVGPLFQRKLTEAVMKGAVVEEVVLADNLTHKQAYKLEYRYLEKLVHDGKRQQLWNIIPPSIHTPQEHEAYVKKLTENLTSKDRLTRVLARMQLIRLGRYEDERQALGGGVRSANGLTLQHADSGPASRRHTGRGRSQLRRLHVPLDQAPGGQYRQEQITQGFAGLRAQRVQPV